MKVREILRLIHDDGWRLTAQRGSHRQFKHPVKPGKVTVAGHPYYRNGRRDLQEHPEASKAKPMREYVAVFEKTSTGWSAYVPDLPGLGVAGETSEETESLLREGVDFHIEGLVADGDAIPEPATRVMTLPISA